MKIVIIPHATERMNLPGITEGMVRECFEKPDKKDEGYLGRKRPCSRHNSDVGLQTTMNISYDQQADAMYIKLRKGTFGRNEEVSEGIVLDISKKGELLGIEILNASTQLDLEDSLGQITFQLPMNLIAHQVQKK